MADRPVVAVALGDPAGIGAELAARLLTSDAAGNATLLVLGDKRLLDLGARQAGVRLDLPQIPLEEVGYNRPDTSMFVDLENCDPSDIALGRACEAGGFAALDSFRCALAAADLGFADSVLFTPFNKSANRMAQADFVDEVAFITRAIQSDRDGAEFNVLDQVWNARVTSHVPLSNVASRITVSRVLDALHLTHEVMEGAGITRPRIAVAALNPHAGDGGNFGHEDDDIISPAVQTGKEQQIAVEGPIPSDTVFVRALKGEFDAVLTMYHDQGQIAMKLAGFDRGVTLIAGYPFPIVTPAHGSAYDIAGQGAANINATVKALALAVRLARDPHHAPFRDETLEDLFARARAMGHAGGAAVAATAAAALAL